MNRAPACIIIAAVLAAMAGSAASQNYGFQAYRHPPTSRDFTNTRPTTPEQRAAAEKARKLAALRKEALKLRKADGGTLSDEHTLYVQARMDAINGASAAANQASAAVPTPQ